APGIKGLGLSLSARLEGVPSSDLFGSSAGFRRPGYSIGIEPGLSYSFKKTAFSVSVPWLVRRDRTQSYADKLATVATGKFVNGDAAFADYIVIAGFSRRF
ncbi:MAG TPA: transporter, partial [Vicinamibacteria bacterium]|nr:transporter [Vicinamibacteria bacterium]